MPTHLSGAVARRHSARRGADRTGDRHVYADPEHGAFGAKPGFDFGSQSDAYNDPNRTRVERPPNASDHRVSLTCFSSILRRTTPP